MTDAGERLQGVGQACRRLVMSEQHNLGIGVALEHLGYKSEFKRDFSFLGLFSLSLSELAVLPGVAGTIW